MRSIWKGHIRFSLVTIPIRIYNAVDTTEQAIRFNQLHKEDNGPVGYDKKCKKCGKVLGTEEIVKGYQFEPEQYVVVSSEDFEKLKLKSTKVIEIEGFIDASEVVACIKPEAESGSRDMIVTGALPVAIDGRTTSSGTGV